MSRRDFKFAKNGVLDVAKLKRQFPVLERSIRGKKLVYLDSGATALKPRCVIESILEYYELGTANIHRGVHLLSEEATSKYERTRSYVQKFLNVSDEREVVFTTGTTGGINLVAKSFVKNRVRAGDEILITMLEHHANIVPWQMLCEEINCKLVVAKIHADGTLDLEHFEKLLNSKTKFISVTWISNALGTLTPVEKIIQMANLANVPILIDAAQAAAHEPIDVQKLNCDFLVFSGHKVFGPTGVGILFGKLHHLESMPPLFGGGDMIKSVTFEKSIYADPPSRFEAGTTDIPNVIALGEALRFIVEDVGFEAIKNHERSLQDYANKILKEISGLKIIGDSKNKAPIFSLTLGEIHPHDMGTILDSYGVAVRTGHHCAQPLLDYLGCRATARACFSIYNDHEDVDILAESLLRVKEMFA